MASGPVSRHSALEQLRPFQGELAKSRQTLWFGYNRCEQPGGVASWLERQPRRTAKATLMWVLCQQGSREGAAEWSGCSHFATCPKGVFGSLTLGVQESLAWFLVLLARWGDGATFSP